MQELKRAKLTLNVGGFVESPVPHGQVVSAGAEAADGDVHPLHHHGQAVLRRRPYGERAAHVRAVDLVVRQAQVQRAQLLVLQVDQVPAVLCHHVCRGGTVTETVSERNGRWGWGENWIHAGNMWGGGGVSDLCWGGAGGVEPDSGWGGVRGE